MAFSDAVGIFRDETRVDLFDYENSRFGEDRFKTLGAIGSAVIAAVIHVEHGNRIRIISARRATKQEKMLYYGQFRN